MSVTFEQLTALDSEITSSNSVSLDSQTALDLLFLNALDPDITSSDVCQF